jgi:hypothetical protein
MGDIMEIVSDDTYGRTASESIRPSSENRHTTARFGRMVARGAIGRVWVRVVDTGYL